MVNFFVILGSKILSPNVFLSFFPHLWTKQHPTPCPSWDPSLLDVRLGREPLEQGGCTQEQVTTHHPCLLTCIYFIPLETHKSVNKNPTPNRFYNSSTPSAFSALISYIRHKDFLLRSFVCSSRSGYPPPPEF